MQFALGRNGVFFLVLFAFAADFESGGINNHEATPFQRFGQDMPGQGNVAEVSGDVGFHDTGQRIHEPKK